MASDVDTLGAGSAVLVIPLIVVAAFLGGRASMRPTSTNKKGLAEVTPEAVVVKSSWAHDRLAFFAFTRLVLDELPVLLREFFKRRLDTVMLNKGLPAWTDTPADGEAFWHGVYDPEPWCHVEANGSDVVRVVSDGIAPGRLAPGDRVMVGSEHRKVVLIKPNTIYLSSTVPNSDTSVPMHGQLLPGERNADHRMSKYCAEKVLSGDRSTWDLSLLCFALLSSSHGLLAGEHEARGLVTALRELRNDKFGHVESCRMQQHELVRAIETMDRFVARCLPDHVGRWAQVTRGILQSTMQSTMQQTTSLEQMQNQLEMDDTRLHIQQGAQSQLPTQSQLQSQPQPLFRSQPQQPAKAPTPSQVQHWPAGALQYASSSQPRALSQHQDASQDTILEPSQQDYGLIEQLGTMPDDWLATEAPETACRSRWQQEFAAMALTTPITMAFVAS